LPTGSSAFTMLLPLVSGYRRLQRPPASTTTWKEASLACGWAGCAGCAALACCACDAWAASAPAAAAPAIAAALLCWWGC
jgi:hypothetical protein